MNFKRPQSGLNGMTVLNTHMHFMTAKNAQGGGFKKAHHSYWTLLANWIKEHDVRVLAGDFNMALWLVVPRLAEHGINMQYVASYAWECLESTEVHVDSCGVFVRGSWSIKCSFELGEFSLLRTSSKLQSTAVAARSMILMRRRKLRIMCLVGSAPGPSTRSCTCS